MKKHLPPKLSLIFSLSGVERKPLLCSHWLFPWSKNTHTQATFVHTHSVEEYSSREATMLIQSRIQFT